MAHVDSFPKSVRLTVRNLREEIGIARTVEKSIGETLRSSEEKRHKLTLGSYYRPLYAALVKGASDWFGGHGRPLSASRWVMSAQVCKSVSH
jgi:hypothetical protein